MGAWNLPGLVYRPPTRTPTSMLCASSSVRSAYPFVCFRRSKDSHLRMNQNSTHARPIDIHQRPYSPLTVRSSPLLMSSTDGLSVFFSFAFGWGFSCRCACYRDPMMIHGLPYSERASRDFTLPPYRRFPSSNISGASSASPISRFVLPFLTFAIIPFSPLS